MATKKKMLQAAAGAGGAPEGAWDLSYAYYDDPNAWDVSTAVAVSTFSVAGQATFPSDIFFKPDGGKMYILDDTGNDVHEYNLSTAWDTSTASHVHGYSVSPKETSPEGLAFKSDGTKMYVCGRDSDAVHEYDLSSAWDVSTAVFNQSFSVFAQESAVMSVRFKPDGTKMYILGTSGDDVNEYSLSVAWDISTASFVQNFSVSSQFSLPFALDFKTDGTKMYVMGANTAFISEYALSTPWDISSAVHSVNKSITGNTVRGVFFNPDGSAFYYVDSDFDNVYQYGLGGVSVAAQETSPRGVFFDGDGLRMYITGTGGDDINEYSLSTAYDTSTASYVRVFDTGTVEGIPYDLFFKPDGTALYLSGGGLDGVSQWSLSTPWNVSTLSHVQTLNLSAQSISPTGLFFKPDGTEMYVLHQSATVFVSQYSLSTAWDISTASHLQDFDVTANSAGGSSISFKPDGTKMYVIGSTSRSVAEYNLSTAWDISTASYSQSFSVSEQDTNPQGMFFHPEGTQMFMAGALSDRVYTYTLGVQP